MGVKGSIVVFSNPWWCFLLNPLAPAGKVPDMDPTPTIEESAGILQKHGGAWQKVNQQFHLMLEGQFRLMTESFERRRYPRHHTLAVLPHAWRASLPS